MINKIETPKTRPSKASTEKNKKKKVKNTKQPQKPTEEKIAYLEDNIDPPTKSHVSTLLTYSLKS